MQGLKQARLQTNLLPGEIRAERVVRGKKPWAVAAAALLMIGLGALGFSYYLGFQAYGAPVVAEAETKANDDAKTAAANEKKFNDIKAAALKEEDAVKSIIAGQAERKNWLELTHYLFGKAVPNPDGSNLSEAAKREYMEQGARPGQRKTGQPMTGQQAYVDMGQPAERRGAGAKDAPPSKDAASTDEPAAPGGGDDLGAGIDDLVQTNIEYFDQRFCDDLGAFWEQVKKNDKAVDLTDPDSLQAVRPLGRPRQAAGGQGLGRRGPRLHLQPEGQGIHRRHADGQHLSPQRPAGARRPPAARRRRRAHIGRNAAAAPAAKPSDKDAYLDKISHVVLYNALSTQTSDTNSFNIVGQSVLDPLVKSGAAARASTARVRPAVPCPAAPCSPAPPGGPARRQPLRRRERPGRRLREPRQLETVVPGHGRRGRPPTARSGQPPAASNVGNA